MISYTSLYYAIEEHNIKKIKKIIKHAKPDNISLRYIPFYMISSNYILKFIIKRIKSNKKQYRYFAYRVLNYNNYDLFRFMVKKDINIYYTIIENLDRTLIHLNNLGRNLYKTTYKKTVISVSITSNFKNFVFIMQILI